MLSARLLQAFLVFLLIFASFAPNPVDPDRSIAQSNATQKLFLPLLSRDWTEQPQVDANTYEVNITDKGFQPPIVVAPPGAPVVWRNLTASPVNLVLSQSGAFTGARIYSGSGDTSVPIGANGGASVTNVQAGDLTFYLRERPDQRGTITGDTSITKGCPDPSPRPAAPTEPAELVSPPMPDCTPLPATAPPSVSRMPSVTQGISVTYSMVRSVSGTEVPYEPGLLVREDFGTFTISNDSTATTPFGCSGGGLPRSTPECVVYLSRDAGWDIGTSLQVEAVGAGVTFAGPPRGFIYAVQTQDCNGKPVSLPAFKTEFDPSISYNRFAEWSAYGQSPSGSPPSYNIALDIGLCPDNLNRIPAKIVGVAVNLAPLAAPSDGVLLSSDYREKITIGGVSLGEFTAYVLRPRGWAGGIARLPYLAYPADARGGTVFVQSGEYLAPLHLFHSKGQGITTNVDLSYSSYESLFYRGAGRLPDRDKYVPSPMGQGWTYSYGIRLLMRRNGLTGFEAELIGPDGNRTILTCTDNRRECSGGPSFVYSYGGLPWLGPGTPQLTATGSGWKLWTPSSGTEYFFDSEGRFTQQNIAGYATPLTITYEGSDQMVRDSGGSVTRFHFNGDNRIDRIDDPLGQHWNLVYTNDSLTSITHSGTGAVWRFAYDQSNFWLSDIQEPGCRVTHLTYADGADGTGLPYGSFTGSVTSRPGAPNGPSAISVTQPATNTFQLTGPDGGRTTYRRTANYSVSVTDAAAQTHEIQARGPLDHLAYDVTRYTDPAGNATSLLHSYGDWRVTDIVYPDGKTVKFTYKPSPSGPVGNYRLLESIAEGPFGDVPQPMIVPVARVTRFAYDSQDRLAKVIDPDDIFLNPQHPTVYEYDDVGRLRTVTDGEGRQTTFAYGGNVAQTNLVAIETRANPAGDPLTLSYTYDAMGQVTSVTDGRNKVWQYKYDTLGRLVKATAPGGAQSGASVRQHSYDPVGGLATIRNGRGYDTVLSDFDLFGQPRKVTYPDNSSVSFDYDASGRPKTLTNALQGGTTLTPDWLGRLKSFTGPNGEQAVFSFDSVGNVKQVSRGGLATDYSYDSNNRLKSIEYPSQTIGGTAFRPTQTFRYWSVGPVFTSTVTMAPGVTQGWRYQYDMNWQPVGLYTHDGSPDSYSSSPSFYSSASYDNTGLMAVMTGTQPTWPLSQYPPGTSVVDNGGTTSQMQIGRDYLGRTAVVSETVGIPLAALQYDNTGNVIGVRGSDSGYAGRLTPRVTAEYDERGQLGKQTDSLGRSSEYAYDGNGNLSWSKDELNCTAIYTYDAMDQLTHLVEQIAPPAGATASRTLATHYDYDAAGNLTGITGPYDTSAGLVSAAKRTPAIASGLRYSSDAPPADAPTLTAQFDTSSRPVTTTIGGRVYTVKYRTDQPDLPDRLTLPDGKYIQILYDGRTVRGSIDSTGKEAETWELDGAGRPAYQARGLYSVTKRWDLNWDEPSRVTWAHGSDHSATYTQLPDNHRLVGQITEPDGALVRYRHDGGRLAAVERESGAGSFSWAYSYYPDGTFQGLSLPGGISVTVTYCAGSTGSTREAGCAPDRIKEWIVRRVAAGQPSTDLVKRVYTYNPNAQVVVHEERGAATLDSVFNWNQQGLQSEQYSYHDPTGAVTSGGTRYCYGAAGDRIMALLYQNNLAACNNPSAPYAQYRYYDDKLEDASRQELVQVSYVNASGDSRAIGLQTSDGAGNVHRCAAPDPKTGSMPEESAPNRGTVYSYDNLNRLISVSLPIDTTAVCPFGPESGGVSYTYLPDGSMTSRSGAGGTSYRVDLGIGVSQERDSSFNATATYLDDPVSGAKLARYEGASNLLYSYVYSPEGVLVMTVAPDGTVQWQEAVDAFGRTQRFNWPQPTVDEDYALGGNYRDPEARMVQIEANAWYHPYTGRFLQRAGSTGTASPYQFSGLAPRPATPYTGPSLWDTGSDLLYNEIGPSLLRVLLAPRGEAEARRSLKRRQMLVKVGALGGTQASLTGSAMDVGSLVGLDATFEAIAGFNAEEGRETTTFENVVGAVNLALLVAPAAGKLIRPLARAAARVRSIRLPFSGSILRPGPAANVSILGRPSSGGSLPALLPKSVAYGAGTVRKTIPNPTAELLPLYDAFETTPIRGLGPTLQEGEQCALSTISDCLRDRGRNINAKTLAKFGEGFGGRTQGVFDPKVGTYDYGITKILRAVNGDATYIKRPKLADLQSALRTPDTDVILGVRTTTGGGHAMRLQAISADGRWAVVSDTGTAKTLQLKTTSLLQQLDVAWRVTWGW